MTTPATSRQKTSPNHINFTKYRIRIAKTLWLMGTFRQYLIRLIPACGVAGANSPS